MPQPVAVRNYEPAHPQLGRDIARQFLTFCQAALHGPGTERHDDFCRVRTGAPHPFGNFALLGLDVSLTRISEAMQPLLEVKAPSALILTGGASPEVESLLSGHGFHLAERMPLMAADLEKLESPGLPGGYTFHEIDPQTDSDAWSEAMSVGYEIPLVVAKSLGPQQTPHRDIRYYAVARDDRFVATSTMFLESGFAGIYCVATRPEERGKGLGGCVTAQPLHLARQAGYRVGILQSSLMGEPVYRRLGFESFGELPLYVHVPG